jgi:tetratricopeptide (TPR) repeat protein
VTAAKLLACNLPKAKTVVAPNAFGTAGRSILMEQTPDEIFDDANGDLAVGDLDSAVEKYGRCVQIAPDFFDGWHALGMALMKLGRFNEAIEAGKKAVELRPNDQIGWTSLSLFYNRAGNVKEAEAAGAKAKILSWGGKVSKE